MYCKRYMPHSAHLPELYASYYGKTMRRFFIFIMQVERLQAGCNIDLSVNDMAIYRRLRHLASALASTERQDGLGIS